MGIFDFLKPKKDKSPMDAVMQMMIEYIEQNPQACKSDEIPQGSGEFGLDIKNPVPVKTIPGNEIYLKRLRTIDGENITWKRDGSREINEIWGNIDVYNIFDSSGNKISTIYISPYHWKISQKAPKGFKII
ncbi:MAG: hypothetical protein CMD02_01505 [Flavobacteriales bacterium]|nr:hypothetical protein [Flavobacteriales bacterium]|tara:strand:+ start:1517 stop:1909 length:393 start_codon:yes stop_codon:yes gene_type:complete